MHVMGKIPFVHFNLLLRHKLEITASLVEVKCIAHNFVLVNESEL